MHEGHEDQRRRSRLHGLSKALAGVDYSGAEDSVEQFNGKVREKYVKQSVQKRIHRQCKLQDLA